MDALDMLFAGALEGGAEWLPFLLLAGVLLVGVALSGGVLAWLIARHWAALVMGTLAFAVVAWWTRVRFGVDGETALLTGWMGSAVVAVVLGVVTRLALSEPRPRRRAGRAQSVLLITAVAGLSVVLAGLVRSGVAHQTAEDATRSTRSTAEQLAQVLADSEARTANDLALLAAHSGPGRQVVRAEGDRDADGAVLVVRISWSVPARNDASWCWRYQLRNGPDDHLPAPVSCPDAPPAVDAGPALGQYNDGLYDAVLHLPPESSDDLDAIRGAADDLVDFYIASSGTEIEVDRLGDGLVGVAVRVGLTGCVITLIDTADHETAIDTWLPDPALLRSDQPGCVPALARSNPDAAPPQEP